MKNASTRLVFEYWDALRGERSAPERGEIEPGALRHALADTFVLENEPIGPVFRLAGTRIHLRRTRRGGRNCRWGSR